MIRAGAFLRVLALGAAASLAACAMPCDPRPGDVLPLALADGRPAVPVEVNGRRVPFLLDTGASNTALFTDGANALRLPQDRMRTTFGRGVGGTTRERNALIGQFRIGGHSLSNLTVPVVTHSTTSPLTTVGVIGADILRTSELEIDFPNQRYVLHSPSACAAAAMPWPGADVIPLDILPNGLPRVRVRVNGTEAWALLDSGADHSTVLRGAAERLGVPQDVLTGKPLGVVHGVGAARVEFRMQNFETIEIGSETLRNHPMGIIDLEGNHPFDMVLGMEYIAPRHMWLSYLRRQLFVQPPVLVPARGGRKTR